MSLIYNVRQLFCLKRLLPAYLPHTSSQRKLEAQIRGALWRHDEGCSQTHLCAVETLLSLAGSLSARPSSTCCRGDPVWSTTSLLLTSTPRMRTPPPPPPPPTPPPPPPAPTQPGRAVAIPVVMTGSASARLPSQDMGELRLPVTTTGGSAGLGEPLRGASRAWRSKLGWRLLGGLEGSGASGDCREKRKKSCRRKSEQ